jgi:PAS domain S-box-containing protein
MDIATRDTGSLIRKLSRRQWKASLAVVALTLVSLVLGWALIANNEQAAEIINLAGRQRMLSQRMAMYLALQAHEADRYRQHYFLDATRAAANDFEAAHARLAASARTRGPGSAIHSLYFGPDGSVDANSRRFLAQVRVLVATSARMQATDHGGLAAVMSSADNGMIRELHEAAALFQRDAEQKIELMLRLLQLSTILIAGLVIFVRFRVFLPVARRLTDDVAVRDQVEQELRESEARFKAFSESTSDWFWQTDAEDRFAWFEDGRNSQVPIDHATVLGRTRMECLPAVELANTEKWRRYQADLAAHRPFRDLEYQIGGDGRVLHWISVSGQARYDDDGNFLGYRGTARNIQVQRDNEAARQRLLQAIEQSPVSIAITDAAGTITYINAHYSTVSGYSAEEAIGRTQEIVRTGDTPGTVYADMGRVLGQGKVWRGELGGRRKNGELYWEDISVSPVHDHLGRTTHYIAVSEDITARKQSARREQERNRILEAVASGAPLAEVLGMMATMVETELPGGLCGILRLDRARGTLHNACASSLPPAWVEAVEGLAIGPEVGACGTAAYTAARVVASDIATDPRWHDWRELAAREGLRACWSQPIISTIGKVLGTLAIYHRDVNAPANDEIRLVETISSLAAICMERDEAEQQTRQLLVEHETILGNAQVGIVYLKQRRVVSCNRRLEEIFGYDSGELIGESSERFYDTKESFEAIGAEAYRVVGENRNFSTELVLKRKDGKRFRGALNGCAIDPAHPQEGSIWVYADISERHEAEQQAHKLLQAVEQSPVSIVITTREGLIEYVNPRFSKVTGYSAREVLGQNPRILQSGETPPETYRELWQTLLAGGEWRGVLRNRRKNGELFWEEASMSPILDDTGQTTHFIAVKEDITERWHINEELQQHRAHLEELVAQRTADLSAALEAAKAADQAKDVFLAHVSHELRTPLNAVIGLSDLARRLSTDPRQQDYLDKATGAGRTLAGIINDLLDLSKISASRMELETTTFSLRRLIQRSKSVMAHRADEKGLILMERIGDEVPDVLMGDPLRIEQILLNLLSNAIKFTPAGRVELRIGLDACVENRICLGIDVEDTGIGLTEDSITRLFQPFAQADASMSRRFGGTGLGLALCKRLAELMDGDIGVTSREGVGTTFHVSLWLSLGDAADLPEAARTASKDALPASYGDAHVLVVDDQPLNREVVAALLAEVGVVAEMARNGQEALDILRAAGPQAFDLVLMDIQMPIMDGLAATREIRDWEGYADLPIIAMTAHTMQHEREISSAAGMNDHIGKPFDTIAFFQLLAHWIPATKHRRPTGLPDAESTVPAIGLSSLRSIDVQAGLARFVGNEKRYRHWLTEFLAEAPGYAAQIRQTLAAGNPEAARQQAHAIKGRVGMLGMTGLHPLAAELEAALMHGAPTDGLLDRIQATVEQLCAEIRTGLGADGPGQIPESALDRRPAGPMPESLSRLIVMLERADGDSVEAIERCLAELKDPAWVPSLRQALALARNFDFDAAGRMLAPDSRDGNTGSAPWRR